MNYKKVFGYIAGVALVLLGTTATMQVNDVSLDPDVQYGTLVFSQSGTELDPIVIEANGANIRCVEITGNWIVLRNAKVHNCTTHGIYLNGGDNFVVEGNEVWNTTNVNNATATTCLNPGGGWGSAIKVKVGSVNGVIRNNLVHENCGEGIAVTRGVNVVVENNTTYDNYAANIYVDNSSFVTVRNNEIYCTGTYLKDGTKRPHAVAIGEEFYSGWGAQLHDVQVTGNTMRDCRNGVAAFASDVSGTARNILVDGNVVHPQTNRAISWDTTRNENVVISNNQVYSLSFWIRSSTGVTLSNNTLLGTSTSTPSRTFTPAPPTIIPPTQTMTPSRTPTPTRTLTAVPISPTVTVSRTPTLTATPVSPTASRTPTVTPTRTATPIITPTFECLLFPAHNIMVCLP